MKLQPSELILNSDGSIYHLHLQPEQIAPVIFLVGDQDRVPKVSRHFDRIEHKARKREFVTHTGWVGKRRVSALSTGIGTDNIDIVLNEIDALFNIDLPNRSIRSGHRQATFIRLGTSGSLQPEAPTDSVVVSTAGMGLDGLLHFYKAPEMHTHPAVEALRAHALGKWDFPLRPYFVEADAALSAFFQKNGFIPGITASNAGFYGPQGRQLRAPVQRTDYLDILKSFQWNDRRIVNLEMETSAIYGLGRLLGHRTVSLNAIIANRATGSFSADPNRAVRNLIAKAMELVENLP